MVRPALLLLAAVVAAAAAHPVVVAHKSRHGHWSFYERSGSATSFQKDEVATAKFTDSINENGWSFLEVHGNAAYSDDDQAYAAGFLEGNLTAQRIFEVYVNGGGQTPLSSQLQAFLNRNNAFMNHSIVAARSLAPSDPLRAYWLHVSHMLTQLQGVLDGYNNAAPALGHPQLAYLDILRLNLNGDMEDLADVFGDVPRTREERLLEAGHCSALLKLLPNNADMFISQITWSTVESMTRVYKLYDLPFSASGDSTGPRVPAVRSAFSSYPASLFSGDDFYQLSSGLVVQETTIGNSNPDLDVYIQPNTVLEWLRNALANRLASDINSWVDVYQRFNSGTYNNQNMLIDVKKFKPGSPLVEGTFAICEQVPGFIRTNDLSAKLEQDRYYGSYNVAYDPVIRNVSGADEAVALFGDWFSYSKTARALIFARNQSNIATLDDMKRMMRFNDYKNDPLSSQLETCQYRGWTNCTPWYTGENTIACRDDLNDPNGVYSLGSFGQRDHVATDAKITVLSKFDPYHLPSVAISGPTYDQVPPFRFSTSPYASVSHIGLPDLWQFPWVDISWD